MKGRFVMVDGQDASGKSIVVNALRDWVISKGLRILDLGEYCEDNGSFPHAGILLQYDAILSAEPSKGFLGKAIRNEILQDTMHSYSAMSVAQAFALDREILYNKVIIPAMKMDKLIIQERGVVASLVYQPVQEHLQITDLMKLPGNRLALKNAPHLLIITKASAEVVAERMKDKPSKKTIFDDLLFQRKLEERYNSTWLKELFERFGSRVEYIDTNPPKTAEQNRQEAVKLWESFYQG